MRNIVFATKGAATYFVTIDANEKYITTDMKIALFISTCLSFSYQTIVAISLLVFRHGRSAQPQMRKLEQIS